MTSSTASARSTAGDTLGFQAPPAAGAVTSTPHSCTPTAAGDAATSAASLAAPLSEAGARALLADIRTAISAAQDLLRLAWRQRIWTSLGHDSWDDFVVAELGDLRLKLPVDDRRAEVATWRAEGASVRAIASALGVSTGTVAGDLQGGLAVEKTSLGVGSTDTPAAVVSLDGRRRPATSSSRNDQVLARPVSLRVLDALAAAGSDGLTLVEVARRLKIRDGSSSGALSRLEAQGHCARTGKHRDRRSVYVLASHFDDAGNTKRRKNPC